MSIKAYVNLPWTVYLLSKTGKTRAQGAGEEVQNCSTYREAVSFARANEHAYGKGYYLVIEGPFNLRDKKGSKPKFSSTMQTQKEAKDRSPDDVHDLMKDLALAMEAANNERLEKLCPSK